MNEQQLANHFVRIRRAFQELNRVANDKNFLKNKAAYARVIRAEHKREFYAICLATKQPLPCTALRTGGAKTNCPRRGMGHNSRPGHPA